MGACREETSDEAAVLHFTYNRFDDLKSRRDRCDCAPTEEDAKRCFILPFDRMVRPAAARMHSLACVLKSATLHALCTSTSSGSGVPPGVNVRQRLSGCGHCCCVILSAGHGILPCPTFLQLSGS